MSTSTWTWSQASDPQNPAADLAAIAAERPDLRPGIAANPAVYPELVDWLASLGDARVDAALVASGRRAPRSMLPARLVADSPGPSQQASRPAPVVAAVVGGLALVVAIGLGGFFVGRATAPAPFSVTPSDGNSTLTTSCEQGDMDACDTLWRNTPADSTEEYFAGTCGNRVDYQEATCVDRLGGGY